MTRLVSTLYFCADAERAQLSMSGAPVAAANDAPAQGDCAARAGTWIGATSDAAA